MDKIYSLLLFSASLLLLLSTSSMSKTTLLAAFVANSEMNLKQVEALQK